MKRHRFNTKVGKSAGIGAYRNKGSDYYEYAPLFRDCSQTGRLDIIDSLVDYSTTIYGSTSYIDTTGMYNNNNNIHSTIWDKDNWLHEEVSAWTNRRIRDTEKVYNHIIKEFGDDFFNNHYIPVFYDNIDTRIQKDFMTFAMHLMEDCAGWKSMELFNFALRHLSDGRMVLYARISWLTRFKSGCDIINYYRLAKSRSFTKVYGF
jgi:hypothetical protein